MVWVIRVSSLRAQWSSTTGAQNPYRTPVATAFPIAYGPVNCGTPNLRPIAMYSTDSFLGCHVMMSCQAGKGTGFKLPGLLP